MKTQLKPLKQKKSGVAKGYLHGFSKQEQDRLYQQARMLEPWIYQEVDFEGARNLLEIGCGVGAQTEILLERFPDLKITGVDASSAQLGRAKKHLAQELKQNRVQFLTADALHLPFEDSQFDGAFVCWLLEHVTRPVEILAEARRVLCSGAQIYCTEVNNSSLFVHPYSPATLRYWFAFNDHQWNLKGDPFVGCKLGAYLNQAGFQDIQTRVVSFHLDGRMPKLRAQFMDYWIALLLSGAPGLLKAGKIDLDTVTEMKRELELIKVDPAAVFFYSCIQATARVW